jgi:hypothetical protein
MRDSYEPETIVFLRTSSKARFSRSTCASSIRRIPSLGFGEYLRELWSFASTVSGYQVTGIDGTQRYLVVLGKALYSLLDHELLVAEDSSACSGLLTCDKCFANTRGPVGYDCKTLGGDLAFR